MIEKFGIVAIVAGLLTTLIMGLLKRASGAIATMNPLAKQVVVVLIAAILTTAGKFFGLDLPSDIGSMTPEIVTTLISAMVSMAFYSIGKAGKEVASGPG